MNKIAVIFPGMGYGKDKPLLYYAARQAKELGYEIRYVDYDDMPPMKGSSIEEKTEWTEAAYRSVIQQLADIDWAGRDIVFIAKSVGTIIASKYASDHDLRPLMLLLTPLDETCDFLCEGRNFFFTGELDPWFDVGKHEDVIREKVEEVFLYGESNHSLEGGSIDGDIDILHMCIKHIRCIITGEDWTEE